MLKSISDAIKASITSPEQGAQHECNSNLLLPSGNSSFSRLSPVLSISSNVSETAKLVNFLYLCTKLRWIKKSLGFPLVAFGALLAIVGCMRNDDEPAYPKRPIARLYVSIEDYQYDAARDDINNVVLIDPADTSEMYVALNHDSEAIGGAGIHFNPFAGRLFQAGYNDTTIRVMNVGSLGALGNSGSIGNGLLKQMRGIAYHHRTQLLYVASATTIYGFHQPMNRNGFPDPDRDF